MAATGIEKVASENVAVIAALQSDLGNGRALTFTFNFSETDTVESMNKKVDTLLVVVDRQRARHEIAELEAKIDQIEKTKAQMERDLPEFMLRADKKMKTTNSGRFTTADEAGIENLKVNIQRADRDLAEANSFLVELQKKAA